MGLASLEARTGSDKPDMARPFEQIAPDRLQIREGGGCIGAFGLPFFAAGVFMLLLVAGVVPVTNAGEMSGAGWLVLLFMGVVFSAVGGTLAFGRSWTTLDVTQHMVVKQWGLLIPMKEQTHPLRGYTAVTLGYVQGDSDTADRFPVGLKARPGADLPLCSYTAYATSRDCAVAVASATSKMQQRTIQSGSRQARPTGPSTTGGSISAPRQPSHGHRRRAARSAATPKECES